MIKHIAALKWPEAIYTENTLLRLIIPEGVSLMARGIATNSKHGGGNRKSEITSSTTNPKQNKLDV